MIFTNTNRITAKFVAVLAVFSMLLSAFPASFFVALAATPETLFSETSTTVDNTAEYSTGAFDASSHTNLMLAFDYDAEALDNGDSFTYGWRSGATDTPIDTVSGADESGASTASDEIDSVSFALPTGAQVADLEIYVSVSANTGSPDDEVVITDLTVTGDAAAPAEIIITNIAELRAAIEGQADGQTWTIQAGDYGMDRFNSYAVGLDNAAAGNQTGWYFPITADNLTINGVGSPTIYGETFSANGNFPTQNLVSVFGDNVMMTGLTLMPKVEPNKTIEVLGSDFTLEDVVFTPNTKVPESLYNGIADPQEQEDLKEWGGSLYFHHEGNHTIKNVTINNGGVSFSNEDIGAGTHITFDNVNVVNESNIDWINGYRYSAGFADGGNTTTGLPQVVYHVNDTLNNATSVFENAEDGDTIELDSDITTSEQLTVNSSVVILGNGNTISPNFTETDNDNNSIIGIISTSGVTIENLKIDGTDGISLHGINVFESTDVELNDITTQNNDHSGVSVNGSEVTVDNITTSGNGWHAINADKDGTLVTVTGNSAHGEVFPPIPHIYVDDTTKDVEVIDMEGQYNSVTPVSGTNDEAYFLKEDEQGPMTVFTSPSNGAVVNSTHITGEITDNEQVTQYSFNISGPQGWSTKKWNPSTSSVFFDLNLCGNDRLHNCDENTLPEGEYKVRVAAYDGNGNRDISSNVNFILDKTGPTITVKDSSIGESGVYSEVSFKLFDEYEIDRLTLNGVEKELTNNKWSDLNFVKDGVFGGQEGVNTLIVFDAAGNSTELQFTLTVPQNSLTILNPATNGETLSGIYTFEAQYNDVDEIEDTVYWAIRAGSCNGADMVGNTPALPFHESEYSTTTGEFSTIVDMRDWDAGNYCLVVNPSESAGNDVRSTRTFVLEDITPTLAITNPATEGEVIAGAYTFEAEYIDDDSTADEFSWAIRSDAKCNANANTVFGNAINSGHNDAYSYDEETGLFSAAVDMTASEPGEYCLVINPREQSGEDDLRATRLFEVESPVVTQCEMFSDTETVIVESGAYAVHANEHNNWTAEIEGADWIWNTYFVENPEEDQTLTFEETFEVASVTSATLDVAADNGYKLYMNGELVKDRSGEGNNYQPHTQKKFDVTEYLVVGENTMHLVVTNNGTDGANAGSNPAGVLYRLSIDGTQACAVTTEIPYVLEGYKWNDTNGDGVWNEDEDGIEGWTIYAEGGSGLLSTTTDATGYYHFVVDSGVWEVEENSMPDWQQTGLVNHHTASTGGTSCEFSVGFSSDATYQCDFGNQQIPEELLPVCNLAADDLKVEEGETTTLTWDVEGALSVSIDQTIGTVNASGTLDVQIDEDTTYTMTVTDSSEDETTCSVTIEAVEVNNGGGNGGSSSSGTGGEDDSETGTPSVLGASTSQCGMYLYDYMKAGAQNKVFEVQKLQLFLLSLGYYNVNLNGIFDAATEAAVKLFQSSHSEDILKPWVDAGLATDQTPSGYVFKTTRWKINDLLCPGSEVLPTLTQG